MLLSSLALTALLPSPAHVGRHAVAMRPVVARTTVPTLQYNNGGGYNGGGYDNEDPGLSEQKIESAKACGIAAVAGTFAAIPAMTVGHHLAGAGQWQFALGMMAAELVLFGAVYRCTVRSDDNKRLREGVVGAFSLVRTFAMLPISAHWTPDLSGKIFSYGFEGMFIFGCAALALEYAWNAGYAQPLEGHARDLGWERETNNYNNYGNNGGYNSGYNSNNNNGFNSNNRGNNNRNNNNNYGQGYNSNNQQGYRSNQPGSGYGQGYGSNNQQGYRSNQPGQGYGGNQQYGGRNQQGGYGGQNSYGNNNQNSYGGGGYNGRVTPTSGYGNGMQQNGMGGRGGMQNGMGGRGNNMMGGRSMGGSGGGGSTYEEYMRNRRN